MNRSKTRHPALLLALLLLATSAFAQDDAIGKFFGKYVDDPKFTVISISPRMFRLLSKVKWDTIPADLKQTVTGLTSLRILSTETTPERYFKEAMTLIDHKEYITRFGDDMPAISGWRWGLKGLAGPSSTSTEGDNV